MKKEQLAIREQALLTAALNCFATERCEDVTVARIAKLAGVAKGTVYLHFTSKDEICARLSQDFYDKLAQKYTEITGNGFTRLQKIIETSFSHYLEFRQYRHIVQYCYREHFLQSLNPEIAKSLENIGSVRRQHIAKALELGSVDKSLANNARANLTGICSTLDGALLNFSAYRNPLQNNPEKYNPEQNSQNEFIDLVTHYIMISVGQNKTTSPVSNTQAHSPELTSEV